MDVEYTWMIKQEKNCRQFRLNFPLVFIGQFEHPEERGKEGEILLF